MVELKLKKTWEDINLKDFQELHKLTLLYKDVHSKNPLDLSIVDFNIDVLCLLSGEDKDYFESLNLQDYYECVSNIQFIHEYPNVSEVKKYYLIDGVKYDISKTVQRLYKSTVRELKSLNFLNARDTDNISNLHTDLAVLMVPDGQEYGSPDFDLSKNAEHLQNNISICDVLAVSTFFTTLQKALSGVFASSLESKLRKIIKTHINDKEKKIELIEELNKVTSFRSKINSSINKTRSKLELKN